MTSPARTGGRLLADEALLLPHVPDTGWHTVADVHAAAHAAGVHIGGPDKVETMLKRMRRRGWTLRNRHTDPPGWTRTPTGTAALTGHAEAAVTETVPAAINTGDSETQTPTPVNAAPGPR